MDNSSGGAGNFPGLFNFGSADPSSSIPVTSNPNMAPLSPYLNFDPAYISPGGQPEFIFPEGASHKRGRFELAFSQIGGSVMIGAALGGANGLYTGLRDTKLAGHTGKVRRTQLLNYIFKRGSATANVLGVAAVMYSGFGVLLSYGRGTDDELNTLTAGAATGLLYKSSAGLKRCAIGGLVGLGLSAAYIALSSKDKLKDMASHYNRM